MKYAKFDDKGVNLIRKLIIGLVGATLLGGGVAAAASSHGAAPKDNPIQTFPVNAPVLTNPPTPAPAAPQDTSRTAQTGDHNDGAQGNVDKAQTGDHSDSAQDNAEQAQSGDTNDGEQGNVDQTQSGDSNDGEQGNSDQAQSGDNSDGQQGDSGNG